MRILWISPISSKYKLDGDWIGSGAWIPSLQSEIEKKTDIELGIAFLHSTDSEPLKDGRTTYFPIKAISRKSKIFRAFELYFGLLFKNDSVYIKKIIDIAKEYNPDLVQIWGSEHFYIETVKYLKCPCVVHIQGILNSVVNAYLPPGVSWSSLFLRCPFTGLRIYSGYRLSKKRAHLEKSCMRYVKYWMGPSEWDRDFISILSPESKHFQCNELMRNSFYDKKWSFHDIKKIVILTTLRDSIYKGIDIILKTANVLNQAAVDFEWNVCGIEPSAGLINFFRKKLKINPEKNNINFKGFLNSKELSELLISSDVYVHTSYIENSSTSISEAQLLGVPVIAMHVGGLASTLQNESGVLVQGNDPWIIAADILKMKNKKLALKYSENALKESHARNDKKNLTNKIISIYKNIISDFITKQ